MEYWATLRAKFEFQKRSDSYKAQIPAPVSL